MKAHSTWTVMPHGPLVTIADGLWSVEGSLEGMPLGRRMVIVRAGDGSLIVHSAVAVDDVVRAQIEALGPIKTLLVPNAWHRLDARVFKDRYPAARVLCPAGARKKVQEVVDVDGSYDDFGADTRVRMLHWRGVQEAEGILVVDGDDGTSLVVNDAVFNLPHFSGLFGLIYGRFMGNCGKPVISFVFRVLVVKDKPAFRGHLRELMALPKLKRIVLSHGATIDDAAAVLASL
jgi:hypothetical protein